MACCIGSVEVVEHDTRNHLITIDHTQRVEAAPASTLANLLGNPCTDTICLVINEFCHNAYYDAITAIYPLRR